MVESVLTNSKISMQTKNLEMFSLENLENIITLQDRVTKMFVNHHAKIS